MLLVSNEEHWELWIQRLQGLLGRFFIVTKNNRDATELHCLCRQRLLLVVITIDHWFKFLAFLLVKLKKKQEGCNEYDAALSFQ